MNKFRSISRKIGIVSAVATPVFCGYFLLPVGAASAATGTATSGWTYFAVGAALSGAVTETVQGVAADGGCSYQLSGSGTTTAGATSTEDVEVGEDASTCTAQFEVGAPSAVSASAASTPDPSGTLSSTLSESGGPASSGSDPAIYQDDKWLDPFGIQTNAQEQWLNWAAKHCGIAWTANWKWSWLNDGWNKDYGTGSAGSNCTSAHNYAKGGFDNELFCTVVSAGQTGHTFTYYGTGPEDTLVGTYTGGYSWSYNDNKGGACNSFLHHSHTFTS